MQNSARNIGVFTDSTLNFEKQICNFVKGSFFQLRAIAKLYLKKYYHYLYSQSTELLQLIV